MSLTLSSLIEKTGEDSDLLTQVLSSFSCKQDEDIERFLHGKAVEFEKLSKARTYLICDENQLLSDDFYLDKLKILSVPDNTSNRKRKEIDGLSAKIHGEQIKDFPCYLIGQLSKNSNIYLNELSGKQLLEFASSVISTAAEAVGGRYMMIECRDKKKLVEFYINNGFSEIQKVSDGNYLMIQMIRKI